MTPFGSPVVPEVARIDEHVLAADCARPGLGVGGVDGLRKAGDLVVSVDVRRGTGTVEHQDVPQVGQPFHRTAVGRDRRTRQ